MQDFPRFKSRVHRPTGTDVQWTRLFMFVHCRKMRDIPVMSDVRDSEFTAIVCGTSFLNSARMRGCRLQDGSWQDDNIIHELPHAWCNNIANAFHQSLISPNVVARKELCARREVLDGRTSEEIIISVIQCVACFATGRVRL